MKFIRYRIVCALASVVILASSCVNPNSPTVTSAVNAADDESTDPTAPVSMKSSSVRGLAATAPDVSAQMVKTDEFSNLRSWINTHAYGCGNCHNTTGSMGLSNSDPLIAYRAINGATVSTYAYYLPKRLNDAHPRTGYSDAEKSKMNEMVAAWIAKRTELEGAVSGPVDSVGKLDCTTLIRRLSTRLTGSIPTYGTAKWKHYLELCQAGSIRAISDELVQEKDFLLQAVTRFAAPINSLNHAYANQMFLSEASMLILGVARENRPIADILTSSSRFTIPEEIYSKYRSNEASNPYVGVRFREELEIDCVRAASSPGCAYILGRDFNDPKVMVEGRQFQTGIAKDFERNNEIVTEFNTQSSDDSDGGNANRNKLLDDSDNAGILSLPGLVTEAAVAGTNRRVIQAIASQLWCYSMDELKSLPDGNANELSKYVVGHDVSRNPEGPNSRATFENNCLQCHSWMDGLRGAFYKVDSYGPGRGEGYLIAGIHYGQEATLKYSRNASNSVEGQTHTSNSWDISRAPALFRSKVGWNGATSGTGIRDLSAAIARSDRFYSCMVKKVTDQVCHSATADYYGEIGMTKHRELADKLKDRMSIRELFSRVASDPACVGGGN